MLIGEYNAKLTDKNRIALPKKLRDELDGETYITRGYENCLIILDNKRWNKLISTIEKKPFLNKSVRDTKRFIAGGASEIEWDTQGRFVLPGSLKSYAGIEKELIFTGILDWVEIWDAELWNKKIKELKSSAGEIAERLVS